MNGLEPTLGTCYFVQTLYSTHRAVIFLQKNNVGNIEVYLFQDLETGVKFPIRKDEILKIEKIELPELEYFRRVKK